MEYRYNIRMLGYEVDGPTTILGDNNAVILNTTIPSSQLKKKHNAIAYHRVREMIACRAITFVHIPSEKNLADICTKPLGGVAHHRLMQDVFYQDGVPSLFKSDDNGTEMEQSSLEIMNANSESDQVTSGGKTNDFDQKSPAVETQE